MIRETWVLKPRVAPVDVLATPEAVKETVTVLFKRPEGAATAGTAAHSASTVMLPIITRALLMHPLAKA
jgi:hypothetical protein